jgi:hypothetical protein
VFIVTLFSAVAQENRPLGHVISSNGLWCDEALHSCEKPAVGNTVGTMYPVRSNSRLKRIGSLTGREWIHIRSYHTGAIVSFDCSVAVDCAGELDLQRLSPEDGQPAPSGVAAAFLNVIRRMVATEPAVFDRYRPGILRGAPGRGALRDDVVRLDGQTFSLKQVFEEMPDGAYVLEMCPIDAQGAVNCATAVPARYRWNKSHPLPWPRPNLQPGLYRLYVCSKIGDSFVRSDNFASLFVPPADRYRQLERQFQEVVVATKDWAADDPTVCPLISVYLHGLAFGSAPRPATAAPARKDSPSGRSGK